ncbi:hypothetical protein KY290_010999 [Solanum tuberosum]|uniref:Uncharacterized protein n=1 Tax=Solanum tuberosum TaxID=4113 RepID=A0ABQ7VZC9_SOLTU|nr:hypothetical protein KY290_010999 [Solanum tuberosum]
MHLPVFASNKPESMNDEDWKFEHLQVCGYIRQWVEDNARNHIVNETHARSLSDKLETLYALKIGNNKLFLLKQLMNISGVVTMEYAKSGVLNEEMRRRSQGSSSSTSHSDILVTEDRGRSKFRGHNDRKK